jgi:hypothetical protein
MPAFTANRGYPYSIGTDPADVPEAMQALAEAVEADLQTVAGSIPSLVRPMARLRGTTPVTLNSAETFKDLRFDSIDFNLGGALSPAHNPDNFVIAPQLPGFWFAKGFVTYQSAGSSTLNEIGLILRGGNQGGATLPLSDQNTHVQPPLSDSVRNHHVAGGQLCDGSLIAFRLRAYLNRASGTASYTFLDRSITIFRMTQS